MVLDLQRHLKSGICSFASGSKRRIGFNYQNSRELNWLLNNESILAFPHFSLKIAQYQAFGDYLGLESLSPLEFGLTPSGKELRENSELIARERSLQNSIEGSANHDVALLLGSTWESRFWRADYYVTLILEMWQRWGLVSILVGSRNEKEIAAEITEKVVEKLSAGEKLPLVNLVEKTSLRQLVPLFSSTRLAIGSDSGPMHIAAAVSCPLISLWGSTSPLRSAPYGSQDFVIEAKVGCSPCYKKVCPGLGNLCMAEIRPSMVINKVQHLLQSKGKQVNAGVFTR